MRIEFVNEKGYSLSVCETPTIIERYRNTDGFFEVPLCSENFYKRKWDFVNKIWVEGATPEEIAEQENQQKQELKKQAHDELLPTDWYVVRFIERGIAIPEEIKTQRQAILDKYNT